LNFSVVTVFLCRSGKGVAVFLRRIRPRGKGRRQEYWVLLESYRTAKGSRHRVVAYLGKLSPKQASGMERLAARLQGKPSRMPQLFGPALQEENCPEIAAVDLKNIRLRDLREFGQVYLAGVLWRMLGLDELLSGQMPRGLEDVPWSVTAAILCIARFCHPCSELYIERHFYPKSALADLLGVPPAQVQTDRLYRGLDHLLKQKKAIEQHLRRRLGQLFDLSFDILLYDLTSTYFEGQCAANPMAKRGYSRDSRPDCPQVVIALVVTSDGYPLGYELFDGNTADSTTVQQIVKKVEQEHGRSNRIWVMDRGNVSRENLAFIRERGGQYIVGTPKAMLRQVKGELSDEGWREVREGIRVKTVRLPDDGKIDATETLVLCKSDDRVLKESAMLERFVTRMEKGLEAMRKSAQSGRLKSLLTAYERLGRLEEKNWRATACFDVKIQEQDGKLSVTWSKDERKKKDLCGCYLLRTNVAEADPVKLWQQYIQLVDAEWAFRITKDELELRPIWHQTADRVRAHVLVCFIAYAMYKTLGGWMKAAGLGDSPRELLEEMAAVKSGDVLLPTRNGDGSAGATLLIRCVTRPDEHTEVLLNRLGIELPNHLQRRMLLPSAAVPEACAM
jgi:transposase